MNFSVVFSFIFFISFTYTLLLGMYTLSLDGRNSVNRLFFAISASICIWSASFSIANSASSHEMVLYWRRFAVIGWSSVYAFVLNYFMVLTKKTFNVKKRGFYLLIYLPTLIVIYVFAVSPLAPERYDFVNTSMGWINILGIKPWDWFFNIYYIAYMLISIYLLFRWGSLTGKKENQKQALIIIISFLTAVILGTLTDIIINKYTDIRVPQLAPVMAVIPLTAIFYCIRYYGLMQPKRKRRAKPGTILSEYGLSKYYKYVSLLYIMGGLAYFFILYYIENNPMDITTKDIFFSISFSYFIVGILIWIIPKIIRNAKLREIVFVSVVTLSIPVITIAFAPTANVTVWVIPLALIMLSLVYNKKTMLFSVGISNLLTQIYVWITTPQVLVLINYAEYIKRVFFISIIMIIAVYVYKVYLYRLKENAKKVKLQKMVSEMSAKFTAATADTLDSRIHDMLRTSSEFFGADRAFVYQFSQKKVTHDWCSDSATGIKGKSPGFIEEYADDLEVSESRENTIIKIPDKEISVEKINLKEEILLTKNDKKTTFIFLLENGKKTIGAAAYVFDKKSMTWVQEDQNALEVLTNILSDTLLRIESEKNIHHLAYHDELTDLPNKRFFDEYVSKKLSKTSKDNSALILINYRDFDLINLTFGYNYAMGIIKNTADKLLKFSSDNIEIFHITVDCFVLFISKYSNKYMLEDLCGGIVEKLQSLLPDRIAGGKIGIVEINNNDVDGDTLLKYASLAADSVQKNGHWDYCFFSTRMAAALDRQRQIEAELKQIIEKNAEGQNRSEIYLNYQPIIDSPKEEIFAFEALARMRSRTLGEISPMEFIPIAEDTQQMYDLGELIIRKACKFLKRLNTKGFSNIKVMINISGLQILREEFVDDFFEVIDEYQINPSLLGIELTESVFSEDYTIINQKFDKIKNKGLQIAIDDFGTGYSSFARVRELYVDSLKIDKYFVDKLIKVEPDQLVTGDIISMAHKLGYSTVAEGVESLKQKQFLLENKCDFIQGYLYSRPVSENRALELLKEYNPVMIANQKNRL